jgi:hypothetical protein
MAIEIAMRALLVDASDVTDLVGTRIYPEMRQQGEDFPAIVYQLVSTQPQNAMDGGGAVGTVATRASMSFDSIAETYAGAKTLASAVRAAIGDLASGTYSTVVIKSCFHEGDSAITESSQVAGDRGVSRIVSDYTIWYEN